MGRINNTTLYNIKPNPIENDIFIGTNSVNNKTVNFKFGSMSSFVNTGIYGNKLLSIGGIDITDNEVTINADVVWKIATETYTLSTDKVFIVPYTSSGLIRTDLIIADENNQLEIITGEEGTISTVLPIPENTVLVTELTVTDASINASQPTLGGDFVKKVFYSSYVYPLIGENISIPLQPNGAGFINLSDLRAVSISGFNASLFTGAVNEENPYINKEILLQNSTINPITLKHDDSANAEFPFYFREEVDIIIPPKGIIRIAFNQNGCSDVFKSWSTVETRSFMTKLYWTSTTVPTSSPKIFGNGGIGYLNTITPSLNDNNIYDSSNGRITNNTGVPCILNISVSLSFGLEDWGTTGGSIYATKSDGTVKVFSIKSASYISGTNLLILGTYQENLLAGEYVTISFSQTSGTNKTIEAASGSSTNTYLTAVITKK